MKEVFTSSHHGWAPGTQPAPRLWGSLDGGYIVDHLGHAEDANFAEAVGSRTLGELKPVCRRTGQYALT